ncbi:MAG: hypothetical protein SFU91_08830 [Chloroherpetonaceae bacterium]|nr:hypothetical protein [Chloroherpetonaceae bacterium]
MNVTRTALIRRLNFNRFPLAIISLYIFLLFFGFQNLTAQELRPEKRGTRSDTLKNKPRLDPTKPAPAKKKSIVVLPSEHSLLTPFAKIENTGRDLIYHRHVEDFFIDLPNIYFRDKFELGQLNELLINGLGTRHQSIFLDDVPLNNPIDGNALYTFLSSESFSELRLFSGSGSLMYSSQPFSFHSETENFLAAEAYTKIVFFQFAGGTSKIDVTFTRNFSETLNFYLGYGREGTDGLYSNLGSQTNARFGSQSEVNRVRAILRYQLSKNAQLHLSLNTSNMIIKPYGGIDPVATTELDADIFDFRRAVIYGQYRSMSLSFTSLKASIETPLPFFSDSSSGFKLWAFTTFYGSLYEKNAVSGYTATINGTSVSRIDSSVFSDSQDALRMGIGSKTELRLDPFTLGLRGNYAIENIGTNNTLQSPNNESIQPTTNQFDVRGVGKIRFDSLLFGTPLEAYGSAGLSLVNTSGTGGLNNTSSIPQTGIGGSFALPLGLNGNDQIEFSADLLRTERLPSLREVFSADSLLRGSLNWRSEKILMGTLSGKILIDSTHQFYVSLTNTSVLSPIAIVQTVDSDFSTAGSFKSIENTLSYSAIGASYKFRFPLFNLGDIETSAAMTLVLNYSLVESPEVDYETGFNFDRSNPSTTLTTNRLYAIPKWFGNLSIFYSGNLFDGALRLKAGLYGYFMSDLSLAVQNSERAQLFFFNLIEDASGLRDNNLQWGVQAPTGRIDFLLWAGVGSGVIFFSMENLLDSSFFKASFFPQIPRTFRLGVSWEILN